MKLNTDWQKESGRAYRPRPERSGFLPLRHYLVEYGEWGSGPPLVLVPGLAGGYGLLGPLAQQLSAHYRVISYQMRGEADCFALRRRFGLDDLVTDLVELLEELRLERPALLGVSFGGVLALELAARQPHRVSSLIVQGVGARFEHGLFQEVAGMVLSQYPLPSDNPFVNQFFNLLFGGRQKPGPLFEFVTRQCWQTDQSVMAHRFRLVERHELEASLPRITAPTLVLAGSKDLLVSPRSLEDLGTAIPHAEVRRLPGCGHLAFVTQPGRITMEVRQFLGTADEQA